MAETAHRERDEAIAMAKAAEEARNSLARQLAEMKDHASTEVAQAMMEVKVCP